MTVQLAKCHHGRFLVLDNDVYIGRLLLRDGRYSEEEVELFAKILRPGDTVVEAGANIGAHTVPLARLVNAMGKVIAFEPQPFIYNLLCGNLALNELHNVSAYPLGLGETGRSMRLPKGIDYTDNLNFGGVSLVKSDSQTAITVGVIPLDRLELPHLRLLKADVEGMEIEVLYGARNTIERCRPYLYIEDDEHDPGPRHRVMRELGYRTHDHVTVLLSNKDDLNPRPGYTIVSRNILGVPEELPDLIP